MRPLSRNLTLTSLVLLSTGLGCASHAAYRNDASYAYMRDSAPVARGDFYDERARTNSRRAPNRPYATTANAYDAGPRGPAGYGVPAPVDAGFRNVSDFHQPLARYGSWVGHPRYGSVFVPSRAHTGHDFRPYTRGNWQYTEWGWTWSSQLPFGWATDHYGRWFFEPRLGWAWVPGTVWAPAWVSWRSGGGYVGWAPLPPGATHRGRYAVQSDAWIFVGAGSLLAPSIRGVMVRGARYRDCYRSTYPQHDVYYVRGRPYYRGPDPDHVRRQGGRVVYRPIGDVDRDRPTSRPPRDVRISNGRDDERSGRRDVNRGDERSSRTERRRDETRTRGDDRNAGRATGRADQDRNSSSSSTTRGDENVRTERTTNTRDDRAAGSRGGERTRDDGNVSGRTQRGESTRTSTTGRRDRSPDDNAARDTSTDRAERGESREDSNGSSEGRTSARRDEERRATDAQGERTSRGENGRGADDDRVVIRDGADRPDRDRNRTSWPTIESPWRDRNSPSPKERDRRASGASDEEEGESRDGVRARKETLRPDTDEVRSPDDNPYDGRREMRQGNAPKMPGSKPGSPYGFQPQQRGKVNVGRAPAKTENPSRKARSSTRSNTSQKSTTTQRKRVQTKRKTTTTQRKSVNKRSRSSTRSSSRSRSR